MNNINFYKTDLIKKYLPKEKDPQKDFTGMNINTRILMCGASGTGKSNALLNYILLTSQPKNGTFQHIFLVAKVSHEPLYEGLTEVVGKQLSTFRDLKDLPSVQEFPDQTKDKFLVILDDCVGDKDKASQKKITDYYAFSRKKGITTIYLSQSYFQTPKFVRDNCNYIILTSIKSVKDLSRIINEYEMPDITNKQITNMFYYAVKETPDSELNFFKIDTSNQNNGKKFSRNFLDWLDTSQF
jgi:hypothetical protein